MGLFKKKKEKEAPKLISTTITVPQWEDILSTLDTGTVCTEIMKATQACFCIGCPKLGKCQVEKMAKGSNCLHFSTYCSLRDSLKNHPTLDWANVAMRHMMGEIHIKYGTTEIIANDNDGLKKEDIHGEKKRKTGLDLSGPDSGLSNESE
jgi:hypothetical protein